MRCVRNSIYFPCGRLGRLLNRILAATCSKWVWRSNCWLVRGFLATLSAFTTSHKVFIYIYLLHFHLAENKGWLHTARKKNKKNPTPFPAAQKASPCPSPATCAVTRGAAGAEAGVWCGMRKGSLVAPSCHLVSR